MSFRYQCWTCPTLIVSFSQFAFNAEKKCTINDGSNNNGDFFYCYEVRSAATIVFLSKVNILCILMVFLLVVVIVSVNLDYNYL